MFGEKVDVADASIPLDFHSWFQNEKTAGSAFLELPRILVTKVNRATYAQQVDGNFRLGLPG